MDININQFMDDNDPDCVADYVVEASEIGLPPGPYPQVITVDGVEAPLYHVEKCRDGDTLWADYKDHEDVIYRIFND